MTDTDFSYCYAYPSDHSLTGGQQLLALAHCSEIAADNKVPCYFYGNIMDSFIVSKCLSVLARTVRSHYALTPEQIMALRDPIISVGNNQLRFEGFSSCNSVYARVSLHQEAIDGEFLATGCTNVDFNDATVRALNTVAHSGKLILGIGHKSMEIITAHTTVNEQKVSLPNRWIKGLGNVQASLSQLEPAFQLTKIQAIQLFKSLPRRPEKKEYYLHAASNDFRFSPIAGTHSIRIGGIHRLAILEGLLSQSAGLFFYKDPDEQSVAVIVLFKNVNMLFLFSANVFRGFSGEGSNLENMITQMPDEWITGINSLCQTNESFNPALLAIENDIPLKNMDALQASLSSIGLLGFDLLTHQHFYRRLPFKLSRLKSLHPRIQGARQLLHQEEVNITVNENNHIEATVKGTSDVTHKVVALHNEYRCTCNWYTNHQSQRGLCKHILAVKMKLEQ